MQHSSSCMSQQRTARRHGRAHHAWARGRAHHARPHAHQMRGHPHHAHTHYHPRFLHTEMLFTHICQASKQRRMLSHELRARLLSGMKNGAGMKSTENKMGHFMPCYCRVHQK